MFKKIVLGARLFLGLLFVVFGLNGFLQFMPVPAPEVPAALAYMQGLMAVSYFFPFLKACEILGGLLLLTGMFVPLAGIILGPIILQIFLYHRFAAGGPPMDIIIVALFCIIAFAYRTSIKNFIKAKPDEN